MNRLNRHANPFKQAAANLPPADPLAELTRDPGERDETARPREDAEPAAPARDGEPEPESHSRAPASPARRAPERQQSAPTAPQSLAGARARGRKTSVVVPSPVQEAAVEQYRLRRVGISELLVMSLDDRPEALTEAALRRFRDNRASRSFVSTTVKVNLSEVDLSRLDAAGARIGASRSETVSLLLAELLSIPLV